MSTSLQSSFSTHDETHINLIPVGLKEAALDSPTFRAGFTHFSEQFDYLEKWLENYVRSVTSLSQEVANFERLVNGFLTAVSSPPHVSEAVIDHDHTLLTMRRYSEGAKDFWATTIYGLKRMDVNMVEPIRFFLQNDLRSFKEIRRKLEQSQKQLEVLQLRYSAQAKSKDPVALREDASQLHEGRKTYLGACMDFAVTAPSLRVALDKMLVKMFSDQWRDMRNPRDHVGGSVGRWGNDIERIRGWSRELENGEKMFRRELQTARKQIEENAEMALRPSRNVEDYNWASSSAVKRPPKNQQASAMRGIDETEKQGWLNLRTVIGKPARIAWLRRWFYVKNGAFGWFVQGSRSGGVEEGDKVGVLLCGVKVAVLEDRRHCFEVKTKDTTSILQAESQHEFLDWIEAFERAQKKALEETSTIGSSIPTARRVSDAAFAILPPSTPEFTASAADLGLQYSDEASSTTLDRNATLPVPGSEPNSNPANKSGFEFSSHRGSTSSDREGESGRDHVLRIIQKIDLPRKSASGPQMGAISASPIPNSPSFSGGASGIASRVAASYDAVPRGPGTILQTPSSVGHTAQSRSFIQLRELPASSLAPRTLINPPTPTNLSGVAVMVTGERVISQGHIDVTDGYFAVVMANMWGSSNWSYLDELRDQKEPTSSALSLSAGNTHAPKTDSSLTVSHSPSSSLKRSDSEKDRGTLKHSTKLQQGYPAFYPLPLRPHEAQFRLLVPQARQDESLVLVFRASWNVNDTQEFPGRVYATATKFYFYSNHLGLVLISEISLDLVSEVTAAPGRDCDFLFIHLKVGHDGDGPTRITIKTFLEPLNLLRRRLNFLVRNCKTHEGRDLESVLKSLIKMEHDDSASSGSLESWEDVSVNAPFDEGLLHRHALPRDHHRDFRAKVLVDGRIQSGDGKPDKIQGTSKIKLPTQPVDYEPSGMDRLAVKKVFDISPKALFHVMFGDRSAVWQLLYHESRAQRIRQGSWTQVKQGHLRREFEYQIEHRNMFGRTGQFTVVDYQIIDVLNEHLCYVITERKNPWYLPYSQHFQLLSRIVITYIAKSRCKLAIFIKVDWTKPPGFARDIVTRRALDDLELDALDLANVITNQIKKLGAQCHTKKVVQIFGLIGQQTQVSEFMGSERPLISRTKSPVQSRTLAGLYLESFSYVIRSCISSLLIRAGDLLKWISKIVNANNILLSILVVSIFINLVFTSSRTSEWWRDRKTGKIMAQVGVGPNLSMSKAVYLHDLHDAVASETGGGDRPESTCHETFRKIVSLTDMDAPYAPAETLHFGVSSRETLRRLRFTRQQMGSHRHDLLVALRVVNSIEREMIQAELEHWLKGENRKCQRLEIVIRENRTEGLRPNNKEDSQDSAGKGRYSQEGQIRAWHKSYCDSCSHEHIRQLNRETGASE